MNEVLQINDETSKPVHEPIRISGLVMSLKKVTTNNNGVMQILLEGAATPATIPDTAAILALQQLELVNVTLESCED